jgi:flagellar basal-body rod modification protein FlgD
MDIPNVIAAPRSSGRATSLAQTDEEVSKLEFLRLLTTQLQYQDPMQPMDNTEFTAQLAQFSSLEQLTDLNGKIDTLISRQAGLSTIEALGFLGRQVDVPAHSLSLAEGAPATFRIQLPADAAQVTATVVDAAGNPVATVEMGSLPTGFHEARWDGRDRDGNRLPPDDYAVRVAALDVHGNPLEATPFVNQTVTGLDLSGDEPWLLTQGGRTPLAGVIELHD